MSIAPLKVKDSRIRGEHGHFPLPVRRDDPSAQSTKSTMPRADMELAERIRRGDRHAFSDMYAAYQPNVYRFILSRVKSKSDAEDLTQDTFVQALLSISRFKGNSRLITWLLGIARFTCMRLYRFSNRWMTGAHGVIPTQDIAFDARIEERTEALLALDQCEERLRRFRSHDERTIFRLRYYACMPDREIAARIGKSANAVKASLRRSRRALMQNPEILELTAESAL